MPEPDGELRQGWWDRRAGEIGAGGWPLNRHSPGLEAFGVVKAGAGTLFNFTARSSNTGAQFIQIHDATAQPATGAVPELVFDIAATSTASGDFPPFGRAFARGIVIVNSTVAQTYTAGAADCFFDAQYE